MTVVTEAKISEDLERFLKIHKQGKEIKYRNRISQLVATEGKSLIVDYDDLLSYRDSLAKRLLLEPDDVLKNFDDAALDTLKTTHSDFAARIRKEDLAVRIRGLPETLKLRGITTEHLDKFVALSGLAVRTSELKPLALKAVFRCRNEHPTSVPQKGLFLKKPIRCEECEETRYFELSEKETTFIDYQIIRLQELPEELPPGQLPQSFDVDLTTDMVHVVRPGDRIILTGIVRAEAEYTSTAGRLRTFRSRIEGNYVEVLGKEPEQLPLSPEDKAKITL